MDELVTRGTLYIVNCIVKFYFLIKRDYERNNIFRYKEKNIILYKQGLYCILKLSQN